MKLTHSAVIVRMAISDLRKDYDEKTDVLLDTVTVYNAFAGYTMAMPEFKESLVMDELDLNIADVVKWLKLLGTRRINVELPKLEREAVIAMIIDRLRHVHTTIQQHLVTVGVVTDEP